MSFWKRPEIHTRDQELIWRYREERRKAAAGRFDAALDNAIGACFALAWFFGIVLVLASLA